MQAVVNLCEEMGNGFVNEKARTEAFESCVASLFPEYVWKQNYYVHPSNELHGGYFDAAYPHTSRALFMIREDKLEPVEGGDVYMQIARDYQLYVSDLHTKNAPILEAGAPTFLLCIAGMLPILLSCFALMFPKVLSSL
jgi:hypothetical protein